ncbi:Cell surface mannoprotein MP65 [Hypsizygus marmoreus]|uniref:Cell surface mannoprotein MP65 n=1 Tax=Hypsizygus marmoreus TaxID=39966 RepID=A0A369K8F8_HYPMA|nr:Cell surface mannoprotein MP65 [Hypsizygus marmoreus]
MPSNQRFAPTEYLALPLLIPPPFFIMRLSLMLTAFAAPVFAQKATTGFAGIGASNSVGGATKYTCRTQAQWNTVANNAKTHGFGAIRITGFDCDALNRASSAAATYGVKVLAGIWIQGTVAQSMASINSDVQAFRAAYSRWGAGRYAGLTIGNEVNDSPANIMAKVYDVRGYLRSQGVSTPISTVHTWVNIRDNPTLCGADFVAANAHTFYDGNRNSGQAGDFVFGLVVPSLRAKCPGKPVVITESGWPSKGSRFGSKAVASFEDERKAIISLDCAARRDKSVSVYAFEFDDQLWKGNDNERSFGMFWKLNLSGDVLKKC